MKRLGSAEGLFYALYCISTLGLAWMLKVIIKKAMIDVENMG